VSRWSLLLLVSLVQPAWALKPAKHRSIAEAACGSAKLPDAFCRRMGQVDFETDYREWTDLSAHAQTPDGSDLCGAADASAARLETLARALVAAAQRGDQDAAAVALGRAIHTLQDECAHHGMTNEQHAYYSLDQTCSGDQVSPDVQPDAIACATARTERAMTAAAAALAGTDWRGVDELCLDADNQDTCANAVLPTPAQACDFLAEFKQWSGVDSTWNAAIAGPALENAFAAGLRGDPVSTSVCAQGSIDPLAPAAQVSIGNVTCGLTDVGCLGKVDGDGDSADPYGDPPAPSATNGCSAGGGGLVMLLAVVFGSVRSRPRRCPATRSSSDGP
jgi:hypothetical protein